MKLSNILLVAVLCAAGAAPSGFAATLNLSTGQDGSGGIWASGDQPDAYWTVDPPGCTDPVTGSCATPVTSYTVARGDADWYGYWLPNDSSSDWIARNPNITNNGPADYTFYFTFSLTDTTSASIAGGEFAADDAGEVILNGNILATVGQDGWGTLTPFTTATSDFTAGENTLEIVITSSDQYLEAVRLTGTISGDLGSPTPEPSLWLPLMGGLGAMLLARKSRSDGGAVR